MCFSKCNVSVAGVSKVHMYQHKCGSAACLGLQDNVLKFFLVLWHDPAVFKT